MSFWKTMTLIWTVMALIVGVDFVRGDGGTMRFFEFAFLLLQALVAWGCIKKIEPGTE